jgi:effector-binding domain-containing protein
VNYSNIRGEPELSLALCKIIRYLTNDSFTFDGHHFQQPGTNLVLAQSHFNMETTSKQEIKDTTWPERTFVIKRAKLAFGELPSFFGESYGQIFGALQAKGVRTSQPCAIYYSIDEAKNETDVAAAVPVLGPTADIAFDKITLPESRVLSTTHYGSYDKMMPAYVALEKYAKEHGLKRELIIEEYFSDPAVEKDPAKWKTDIHFVVKPV